MGDEGGGCQRCVLSVIHCVIAGQVIWFNENVEVQKLNKFDALKESWCYALIITPSTDITNLPYLKKIS